MYYNEWWGLGWALFLGSMRVDQGRGRHFSWRARGGRAAVGDTSSRQKQAFLAFADRFGDVLTDNLYAMAALGIVLSWMWMGIVKGHPAFMDGRIDTLSVAVAMGSFAVALLAFGFVPATRRVLERPPLWVGLSCAASAVCLVLIGLFYGIVPADESVRIAVVRVAMVVIGADLAVLVACCAAAFACLRPASAAVGFFLACVVLVVSCLTIAVCKNVAGRVPEGVLFSLLPTVAVALLMGSRVIVTDRFALRPAEDCGFAKGYRQMCLAFGVFFFAASAKAALEPSHEFHSASDVSFAGVLLFAFLLFHLISRRNNPVGVFKALKTGYTVAVLVLTVCIALAPLSFDPYSSIIFDADFMVLVMILWLLVSYVASTNECYVMKVVGVAFASAAAGMALGWVIGCAVHEIMGHSRTYFSMILACATAVFCTVGFSSMSFPYLTTSGKGARKMQRIEERREGLEVDYRQVLAASAGLSPRESEVLALLLEGHNAASVAKKLVVSYHTARSHVHHIYVKLDVHSRAELLEMYRQLPERYAALDPETKRTPLGKRGPWGRG